MIALLLAALMAEPMVALEPDALRAPGPSLLDRAGRALRRLVEKPEPNVAEGNARAAAGDVEGALNAYEKAEAPEHGPRAAALAHDRASALLRAGRARTIWVTRWSNPEGRTRRSPRTRARCSSIRTIATRR